MFDEPPQSIEATAIAEPTKSTTALPQVQEPTEQEFFAKPKNTILEVESERSEPVETPNKISNFLNKYLKL